MFNPLQALGRATPNLKVPDLMHEPSQLRVLVVDDNVDGAEVLAGLVASMGCATAVAFDGAQGLAVAADFEPHLALIDLEMPGMGGCELARHFRVSDTSSSAWLICVTGRGEPADRRVCMGAGFDAFFTKPLAPESLSNVLTAAARALLR